MYLYKLTSIGCIVDTKHSLDEIVLENTRHYNKEDFETIVARCAFTIAKEYNE